jgi:aminopeptidase
MYDPRFDRLAEVLVRYSTQVQPDDLVLITGHVAAEPAVAAVYQRGAEGRAGTRGCG